MEILCFDLNVFNLFRIRKVIINDKNRSENKLQCVKLQFIFAKCRLKTNVKCNYNFREQIAQFLGDHLEF
jgi:hypothetical protein